MKKRLLILSTMVLTLILLRGQCPKPDLIVSEFTVGTVTVEYDSTDGKYYWVAPATVKVRNNGNNACGSQFWVATKAGWLGDADYGMYGWKFTVPNKFEKVGAWECKALDVHEEEVFTGTMYIRECDSSLVGDSIDLWVVVDVETGTPPDDKIDESDEDNNESSKIMKVMPSFP